MNTSTCEWCGKEIRRRGNRPPRFCSVDCKAHWQRTQKPVDEVWLRQKYLVEGLSTYDIGKIVGRNPKQVFQWLKGYGIPTRPRGENLKGKDGYMKRKGVPNPFLGKHHTDETRATLSVAASKPKPYLRGERNGMHGRRGKDNPNYRGGNTPERQRIYASGEWIAVVRFVYARDNYTCARCGKKKGGKHSLHAHHIKSWAEHPELRLNADNLITLCRPCHLWVHSNANANREFIG